MSFFKIKINWNFKKKLLAILKNVPSILDGENGMSLIFFFGGGGLNQPMVMSTCYRFA